MWHVYFLSLNLSEESHSAFLKVAIHRGGFFFQYTQLLIKIKNQTNKVVLNGIWTAEPWSGKQWWEPLYHVNPAFTQLCLDNKVESDFYSENKTHLFSS